VNPDDSIREPERIRLDVSRKVRAVQVSDQFTAILACLVGEKGWTTPVLAELVATSDGMLLGLAKPTAPDSPHARRQFDLNPREQDSGTYGPEEPKSDSSQAPSDGPARRHGRCDSQQSRHRP